jgi:formylglycine-generating enzyme required for sulfatase activity
VNSVKHCAALLALLLGIVVPGVAGTPPAGMVKIPKGVFRPFFLAANDPKEIPVEPYYLDVCQVTARQYLEFIQANPAWRRSRVKRIFADESYLKNWESDLNPGPNVPGESPVTYISWFAARAYCDWVGKRLPTMAEWEFAASAGFTRADGNKDPVFKAQVAQWYETLSPARLPSASGGRKNFFGVEGLHGLVWEWVQDFNTATVSGDGGIADRQFFCGAASQGARDARDYQAFMRYGFRSSLKAGYCVHNLGFRCARDLTPMSDNSVYQLNSEWTTDTGEKIQLKQLAGKPQVVAMFFSSCQGACPILVSQMQSLAQSLPAGVAAHSGFVLVTIDPEHDTPQALRAYREARKLPGDEWTLLRGKPEDIRELALVFGFQYRPGAGGQFAHSNLITLLDAGGEIVYQQHGLADGGQLAQHLSGLLRQ